MRTLSAFASPIRYTCSMSRYVRRVGGPGKGWARGLTAATDARIARSADKHRGRAYVRRTPVDLCRWPKPRATIQASWTDATAYVVGLIATDGCLIERRGVRRVDFCSAEMEMVETYTRLVGIPGRYRRWVSKDGKVSYRVQFKHAAFYRWLVSIGLTPRKSLTLGPIAVPDPLLVHLVRGLLDGDGSVINSVWRADTTRRPHADYLWEWLNVRFISASQVHLRWLQERLRIQPGVRGGSIHEVVREDGRRCSKLSFGKFDSTMLLRWIYADPSVPCLERKRAVWSRYVARNGDGSDLAGHGRWGSHRTAPDQAAVPEVGLEPTRGVTPIGS